MRRRLEDLQAIVYAAALAGGVGLGLAWPAAGARVEPLVWPALAVLLYATFAQVPGAGVGRAARDGRFLLALAAANLLAAPLLAFAVTRPLDDDVVVLAALLVLLAPCVDWFVPFARAAGGDGARAATAAPLLLAGQAVALPLLLVALGAPGAREALSAGPFLAAFALLIALPAALAAGTRIAARRAPAARRLEGALGSVPVPALALVVALVGASQVEAVRDAGMAVAGAAAAFAAYALLAPPAGALVARLARLEARAARTVAVSAGTRNSFVVLPLALALPDGAGVAAAVVVAQTLVELAAMAGWVRVLPRALVPG